MTLCGVFFISTKTCTSITGRKTSNTTELQHTVIHMKARESWIRTFIVNEKINDRKDFSRLKIHTG